MFEPPHVPLDEAAWIFALVMALVLVVPLLSTRAKLPPIVGLVLAGMLVGPGVAGLLAYEGVMQVLGQAGLLYLMFMAGLELDLDEFDTRRSDAIRLGSLTFVIPMAIGTVAIAAIGYPFLAALLLAACWASHTLLTYPTFRRHGTVHNRAVSTSVAATIFTDTAALLVLVVVVRSQEGDLGPGLWIGIVVSLIALVALTLVGLPRFGRWFFSELAQRRGPRFVFALVALFGGGALAELGGIEAIVGAFLAGLGLNRLVPNDSALMERIEVLGDDFLIPIFLISVGLLIEPAAIADPTHLVAAVVFSAVVLGSKLLASVGAGLWFGYDRNEIGAMYSLTLAQAAATLAIVIVGIEAGVLEQEVVNPVVIAILVACVVASLVGDRYAPRLPHPQRDRKLGEVVVAPIARPAAAGGLAHLAAAIARADGGLVVPLTVASPGASQAELERIRETSDEAEQVVLDTGAEADRVMRIDTSPEIGILHTIVERNASMLVLGWRGYRPYRRALFGNIVDAVVAKSPVPIVVANLSGDGYQRIVVLASASNLSPGGRPGMLLALEIGRRIGAAHSGEKLEVTVVSNTPSEWLDDRASRLLDVDVEIDRRKRTAIARDIEGEGVLVIVPVTPERRGLRGAPSQLSEILSNASLLFVIDQTGRMLPTTVDDHVADKGDDHVADKGDEHVADEVDEHVEDEVDDVDEHVEDEVDELHEEDDTPEVVGAEPGQVQDPGEEEGEEEASEEQRS